MKLNLNKKFVSLIISFIIQILLFMVLITFKDQNYIEVLTPQKTQKIGSLNPSEELILKKIPLKELEDHFLNPKNYPILKDLTYSLEAQNGDLLYTDFFEGSRKSNSRLEIIPPGKRLYVLQIEDHALQNILNPGDHIDIIAHLQLPEVGQVTEIILENITIKNIGFEEELEKNSIVFFLSPEQVKFMSYLEKFSKFSISLRNPKDKSHHSESQAMTLNKFLANPKIQKMINNDVFRIKKIQ